ncbi:MAG: hypothetical protein ABIN13_09305, partial [Mucilaginibacter sp.]
MKNKNLLLLISIVFFAIASCTKEGSQGPQGEQGDTGATGGTGVAGPAGPSGVDGSVIYSGTGAPSATIGNLKDYYLDRSTGNLYGPKTASGWGNPLTLIGATGAQGSTGATGSTGSQGPKGATGATGATGAQGPTGPAGPKGAIGATGATGANGTNGTNGTNGSQVYSGTAAPAAAFGRAGDYFLDKTT